jgi:hypothetical protein
MGGGSEVTEAVPVTDNLSVSYGPGMAFGSNQIGLSINASATFQSGNFSTTVGFSARSFDRNFGPSGNSQEFLTYYGAGWDDGNTGISFFRNQYRSGETSQTLAGANARYKDASITYQNDWPGGDGGDRFRTAALQASYRDFSVGFNLYTGDPGLRSDDRTTEMIDGNKTYNSGTSDYYRAGILYAGYGNYRFGVNSEGVRNLIQNQVIHQSIGSPYFKVLNINRTSYFQYSTRNPYSLW